METPNTPAGRQTEKIMAMVRQKLPNIPTHEYNRTYEAILTQLEAHHEAVAAVISARIEEWWRARKINHTHLPSDRDRLIAEVLEA